MFLAGEKKTNEAIINISRFIKIEENLILGEEICHLVLQLHPVLIVCSIAFNAKNFTETIIDVYLFIKRRDF